MIECKRHNASLYKPDTCIERQRAIAKGKAIEKEDGARITGHLGGVYHRYLALCGGCETGLKLYKDSLEGKTMEAKMEIPEKTCANCGEKKPATREYFGSAPRGEFNLTKNCLVCLGKKPEEKEAVDVETPAESKATKSGSILDRDTDTAGRIPENNDKDHIANNEVGPAPTGVRTYTITETMESKPCKHCGEEIQRLPEDSNTAWESRKYCRGTKCARRAKQERENLRRQGLGSKKIKFDPEAAAEITRELVENYLTLFASLIDIDEKEMDRIRVLSTRIGIDSQKVAIAKLMAL